MAAYDPIDGMESVVATVSRYDGTERANLIKLISHAGANYVGTLSRANAFTHLVCQKFKGKKYQLAKKLNLKIVNHRWIEECLKQRRRVPEHLYTLPSGQQVGPLRMQVLIAALGGFPAKAWWKWVCERTQFLDEFERIIHPPRGGACPRREVLTDSVMSDEDSFPEFKEKNICQKPENESVQRNLKKELQSSSMHRFQDSLPSTSFRMEHQDISTHSYRAKSNILSGTGSCVAETSRKRRKLMEKDIDNAGLVLSDSDQEFQPVKYHHIRKEKVTVLSDDSDDDLDMQDVGEVGAHVSTSKDPKSLFVDTPTALRGSRQVNCLEKEPATPSSSTACVICLIGFSSIRGILSCGHRFCFNCINEWADHMISRRKMPACPLCKHTFTEITRVDQAATSDQNVFSQTIPSASKVDVSFLTDQGISNFAPQTSPSNTCGVCGEREIEELLISCDLCQNWHIHTYCHDPALTSNIWTCLHCKDLRMLLCRYPRY